MEQPSLGPNAVVVNPVVVRPPCLRKGGKQDCRSCHRKRPCLSPRALCIRPYPNHPRGCPNYDKKSGCPPDVPMFDDYVDITQPVYAIFNTFDVGAHAARMRDRHPKWTERQCYNLLYWQPTARKQLRGKIRRFLLGFSARGKSPPRLVACPEAMGVNITQTMSDVDIELEWPPRKTAYQIVLAGYLLEKKISSS